jgi:hypothetical protein
VAMVATNRFVFGLLELRVAHAPLLKR